MIYEKHSKKFCKGKLSEIENYDKAIADTENIWHCHHRDEIRLLPSGMVAIRTKEYLIENGRYYDCPPNELIYLKPSEHIALHRKYETNETHLKRKSRKLTDEQKAYISQRTKERMNSSELRKHLSDKAKNRMDSTNRGSDGKFVKKEER